VNCIDGEKGVIEAGQKVALGVDSGEATAVMHDPVTHHHFSLHS
jgi:hypothetical protein